MWNMLNCVGAIDGKHIAIKYPPNSGSQYYCYKQYLSIILMAACDAKYAFTYIDVDAYGSQSDGGVFQESSFGKRLVREMLPLPRPTNLPATSVQCSFYFVGDAAFPLGNNSMKPIISTIARR